MTLDSGKLVQGVAGLLLALVVGFLWDARAELARLEEREATVGRDLDAIVDTIDALHPRGSALRGGGDGEAPTRSERLEAIRRRAPSPTKAPAPEGDDDDSAATPSPTPTPSPAPEGDDDDSAQEGTR